MSKTRYKKANRRLYTDADLCLVRALIRNGHNLKDAAAAIDRSVENMSYKNRMLIKQGKEPMWPVDEIRSKSTQLGNKFSFRMRVPNNADAEWAKLVPNYAT